MHKKNKSEANIKTLGLPRKAILVAQLDFCPLARDFGDLVYRHRENKLQEGKGTNVPCEG